MIKVAAVQMASGPKLGANLIEAERLVAEAAADGAQLVVLPENFALMGRSERDILTIRERPGVGPIQDFLATQAARHGIWLVGGTVPLTASVDDKVRACALLFDDSGQQVARYDKLHLFDVELVDSEERYAESATIEPGSQVCVTATPFGRLGIAVCYDLRFPELFREMMDQGAELIALPAAFTAVTGRAHWEVLIRARAIENVCYLIAADQGGYHVSGRETHGHSAIVDPWGSVIAEAVSGNACVSAEVDMERQRSLRRQFPVLEHRRG